MFYLWFNIVILVRISIFFIETSYHQTMFVVLGMVRLPQLEKPFLSVVFILKCPYDICCWQ